jgi:hypothetical protein
VNKDVLAAAIRRDEAKAFRCVEPFYCPGRHDLSSRVFTASPYRGIREQASPLSMGSIPDDAKKAFARDSALPLFGLGMNKATES